MATHILQIDSSIFGQDGVSSQLTRSLVATLQATRGNTQLTQRRLDKGEIPHFGADTIAAIEQGEAALADVLIKEVQQADVIVLGVPMYNFGVPSELKAWFDHIARAGVTFKYTENGPVGLLRNKKVYVVTTRGGVHKDQASDSEIPFLNTMLGFLGLDDVEVIFAEGLNMGEELRKQGIADAEAAIERLENALEVH